MSKDECEPINILPDFRFLTNSVRKSFHRKPRHDDLWGVDAPFYKVGEDGSYDHYFRTLLSGENSTSFQDLLTARKESGLPTNVLDLFGSGFFIEDLTNIDNITGVRLKDSSQEMLTQLHNFQTEEYRTIEHQRMLATAIERIHKIKAFPGYELLAGNLFHPNTWRRLDDLREQRGIPFFDLITAKPVGAFNHGEILYYDFELKIELESQHRINALKFLRLIDRAYTRLSPKHGVLFTEVPDFISKEFLEEFLAIIHTHGKIGIDKMESTDYGSRKNIKLVKQPNSAPDLENLVKSYFKAA